MKTAAMWCVDANGTSISREPRIGAALRAVAVDDIGCSLGCACSYMRHCREVAAPELPAHRHANQSECQRFREVGESGLGLCAAAARIRNHADAVAAGGL